MSLEALEDQESLLNPKYSFYILVIFLIIVKILFLFNTFIIRELEIDIL